MIAPFMHDGDTEHWTLRGAGGSSSTVEGLDRQHRIVHREVSERLQAVGEVARVAGAVEAGAGSGTAAITSERLRDDA